MRKKNVIWASVLLVDDKIKHWGVLSHKKSCVKDFYKDFMYAGDSMKDYINSPNCRVENNCFERTNEVSKRMIFEKLAPQWFSQWELSESYARSKKPY